MLPLDRRAVRDLFRVTLLEKPLTPRRARALAFFGGLFVAMRAVTRVARRVDDLLYPGFRDEKVEAPVFVFANPRSGTTLLQYLMSLDEERFTHFKLWQTILPTVSFYRLVARLDELDRRVGRPLDRGVGWINERLFGRWEGVHEMGMRRPEEDEAIFVYTALAPGLVLLFPEVTRLPSVNGPDDRDRRTRDLLMRFYADTLQRHLYAEGGGRTVLSKNVFTAPRVRSLAERFPDARFVYVVRHPYEAIASCVNLFYVPWTAHSPEIEMRSEETQAVARWAIDYYRRALSFRDEVPPERFALVRYEDLVADPVATVEGIYAHFGFEPSERYAARLREATSRRSEQFKSARRYTLEDWGISRDRVRAELGELFAELGYEL